VSVAVVLSILRRSGVHVHELNWMHLEEYLVQEDRNVLPRASTELLEGGRR
jgi:hypothetical protein